LKKHYIVPIKNLEGHYQLCGSLIKYMDFSLKHYFFTFLFSLD
jgi:hypothetical protein